MESNSEMDVLLIANLVAAGAFFMFMLLVWLQFRGGLKPTKLLRFAKISLLLLLTAPIVVRYHYSEATILYLALGICGIGGLIKLRQKLGI
jgi:hypothetical protein